MMLSGRRRVLALTSSKIGQNSFCHVADANEFDLIITDDGIDPRQARKLSAAGPELAIV
jgi:DeoR family fructose operon transcriptional repressor